MTKINSYQVLTDTCIVNVMVQKLRAIPSANAMAVFHFVLVFDYWYISVLELMA